MAGVTRSFRSIRPGTCSTPRPSRRASRSCRRRVTTICTIPAPGRRGAPSSRHWGRCRGRGRRRRGAAFTLGFLAGELTGSADGLGLLAGALLGRLLVIVPELHLAEDAFALHLLFQRP